MGKFFFNKCSFIQDISNSENNKVLCLFSDFQYGFRSTQSTADFLTVVSDRIARAFNRSGVTRAVVLDIS